MMNSVNRFKKSHRSKRLDERKSHKTNETKLLGSDQKSNRIKDQKVDEQNSKKLEPKESWTGLKVANVDKMSSHQDSNETNSVMSTGIRGGSNVESVLIQKNRKLKPSPQTPQKSPKHLKNIGSRASYAESPKNGPRKPKPTETCHVPVQSPEILKPPQRVFSILQNSKEQLEGNHHKCHLKPVKEIDSKSDKVECRKIIRVDSKEQRRKNPKEENCNQTQQHHHRRKHSNSKDSKDDPCDLHQREEKCPIQQQREEKCPIQQQREEKCPIQQQREEKCPIQQQREEKCPIQQQHEKFKAQSESEEVKECTRWQKNSEETQPCKSSPKQLVQLRNNKKKDKECEPRYNAKFTVKDVPSFEKKEPACWTRKKTGKFMKCPKNNSTEEQAQRSKELKCHIENIPKEQEKIGKKKCRVRD